MITSQPWSDKICEIEMRNYVILAPGWDCIKLARCGIYPIKTQVRWAENHAQHMVQGESITDNSI